MIRRSPTRIELKLDDLQEFDYIQKYSEKNKKTGSSQATDPKAARQERIGYRTPGTHHHRNAATQSTSTAAVAAAATAAGSSNNGAAAPTAGSSGTSTAAAATVTATVTAPETTPAPDSSSSSSSATPTQVGVETRGTGNVFRQLSFSSTTSPNNSTSQANINNMSIDSEFSD